MSEMPKAGAGEARLFLTAEWKALLMVNYVVDPEVLKPHLPRGTELDAWQGKTLASMVGFLFLNTRVFGCCIPFHRDFEEVNLRFYVRRKTPEGWRRGVVFVREIVPRLAIATVARVFYNEPYVALPMRHRMTLGKAAEGSLEYQWRVGRKWNTLAATVRGTPLPLQPGSPEEFIFEHYWGYTKQRDGGTVEYEVRHAPWHAWQAMDVKFDCDIGALYGPEWIEPLRRPPVSAFVADGSAVEVRRCCTLPSGAGR